MKNAAPWTFKFFPNLSPQNLPHFLKNYTKISNYCENCRTFQKKLHQNFKLLWKLPHFSKQIIPKISNYCGNYRINPQKITPKFQITAKNAALSRKNYIKISNYCEKCRTNISSIWYAISSNGCSFSC